MNYVDTSFTDYLNRYLTGIGLLKNKLGEIRVWHELADPFGRQTLRFCINVGFRKDTTLSDDERSVANQYFYNSSNESGSQFVSFVYYDGRGYDSGRRQIEIIKDFIFHYDFAAKLFEGFVKEGLPETCMLEIAPLDTRPFFNYFNHFLSQLFDEKDEKRFLFEREYKKLVGRRFDFDCAYHKELVEKSAPNVERGWQVQISDKELFKTGVGEWDLLRRFVLDNKVLYTTGWRTEVIDEIWMDKDSLKAAVEQHLKSSSSHTLDFKKILNFIEEKDRQRKEEKAQRDEEKRKAQLLLQEKGLEIGSLVLFERNEWGSKVQDLGIVKDSSLNYKKELEIQCACLNKDLSQSKRSPIAVPATGIKSVIAPALIEETQSTLALKTKDALLRKLTALMPKHKK